MFAMLKNMLSKLVKMITNKKVLVVLALLAVATGAFLYFKSQKAVIAQSDVDQESVEQEIAEAVIAMTPESVEQETQDLGQSVQPMPAAPDSTENFAVVGASDSDNFATI